MLKVDIIVSSFKNYRDTIPKQTNLWEWLKDDKYKADIEFLRSLTDKNKRNEVKKNLPCITASGEFSERKVSGLKQHSGLICIDIDSDHNPQIDDFEELRDQISRIANIAYCSLSASGNGVFCLIPIKYPDKHKLHFEALKPGFEELGIFVDKSCGDVSRLRGYSYDSKAYFNMNAPAFTQLYEPKPPSPDNFFKTKTKSKVKFFNETNSKEKVMSVLSKIEKNRIDITKTYEHWFQIGCALANEFGEEGRQIFHSVSQYHVMYSVNKTNQIFTECLNKKYSINLGTFFYVAAIYLE